MRLLLLLIAALSPLCLHASQRPNVLFLFSDDQRADSLHCQGNPHIKTPTLDSIAARGTTLTRAYCMGSSQGAVCVPSRAMLMTGRSLFRVQESIGKQGTWPEQFAAAGYKTFITGKWHNGTPSLLKTFQSGKAVFIGGMHDPYSVPLHDIGPSRTLENKRNQPEHAVQIFADAAIEFLAQQKENPDPFLCYVAFNAPHDPRIAPKTYHERFLKNPPPPPSNFLPQHPFNNGALTIRDEHLAPWPRTPEAVSQHLGDYYAYIEYLDDQIARILRALEATGKADNTLIVFSSDHGLAIGSHGLLGKQNLYDHSMRAPLLIAGPNVKAGKTSDALCYLFDIFPTLGELADIKAPEGSEGKSLAKFLQSESAGPRDAVLTAYTKVQRAIREDRWKLIAYPQINRFQLFDLQNDPSEMHDLAGKPEYEAERNRLTNRLRDLQREAGDVLPLTSAQPPPEAFDFSSVKRQTNPKATE